MDNRKNIVVGTLDTEVEREKLGLEITKEKVIKCPECDTDLLHIAVVKETIGINQKYQAICDKCKCKSFTFVVNDSECYAGPTDGKAIVDISTTTTTKDTGEQIIKQVFTVK